MYCPRCGQQQTSGELVFCPRCGMRLDPVRALVSAAADAAGGAVTTTNTPRRGDINAGVSIMFLSLSAAVALLVFADVPLAGALLLALLFCAPPLAASGRLLGALGGLFSDGPAAPSQADVRPRDVVSGAALMLVCALLSACAATLAPRGFGLHVLIFALCASFLLLLIFSQRLTRAARQLFAGDTQLTAASPETTNALPGRAAEGKALPPAAAVGLPASLFGPRAEATTAEMSPSPSVTERTTSLLGGD